MLKLDRTSWLLILVTLIVVVSTYIISVIGISFLGTSESNPSLDESLVGLAIRIILLLFLFLSSPYVINDADFRRFLFCGILAILSADLTYDVVDIVTIGKQFYMTFGT